jgi:5-formyltetrahydrofolate cyclo-ligase
MATAGKAALRQQLQAARRRVADDVRAAEARMLSEHLERMANSGSTVCAYVPVGAEPGSIEMLDVLLRRAGRVLLPVARTNADDVWLPESALTEASLVLVPALAVDRSGVRLGRGRGFYDRSLACRDPRARLVAMVRDDEFVDELPSEPHDVRMTHALTPKRGLIALPSRE